MRSSGNPSIKKKHAQHESFTVPSESTLLVAMVANFPHKSRSTLKAVMRDGQVSIDGRVVSQFDHPLAVGQQVMVSWERKAPSPRLQKLKIIFEDDELIVIDKPPGLLTVATDKEKRETAYAMLSDYVKSQDPQHKIFVIHRLDRETSGLLMFAKNEKIKRQIQETWEETINQRTYIALVEGQIDPPAGTITSWLTESKAFIVYSSQNPRLGKKAVTHYQTVKSNTLYSLVQLNLDTGRKHQIRVHLQELGHPVVGDKKYGSNANPLRRMALHAQVLAFTHPRTGEICCFRTPVPARFLAFFRAEKPKNGASPRRLQEKGTKS